jgi:hypothetical protein
MSKMHTSDHTYLNKLADVLQYPAARCAMGEGIYMYHRTSSAAVESKNAANKEICDRTAVDLVNATILLLRLECTRFNKMKDLAWRSDNELTPRGELEFAEAYNDVNYKVMPLTQPIYPYNPVTRPEGRLNYVVVRCKCRLVLAYDKIGVASQNYCTTVQYS